MKSFSVFLLALSFFIGCRAPNEVDATPPAPPQGIKSISLDNAVELQWYPSTDPDVAGYNVWSSDRYDGRYELLGSTNETHFVDTRARNGVTYYYAVSSYDFSHNESPLSKDVVYDTPRPEGYGIRISDYRISPIDAGYDFSTYSVGRYDDKYTDVFFENANGRFYFDVWNDTDIQDMGYTSSLDDISAAPGAGWAPSKSAEAIVGHTYVIWTWDDHYAKVRVRDVTAGRVVFDWAYQVSPGNPELKRNANDLKRQELRRPVQLSF